jgi:hypothetical protein
VDSVLRLARIGAERPVRVRWKHQLPSNVSLVVRPDGNFEIIQRHGLIALSTSGICGPYRAQQPTTSYPPAEAIPSQYSASIYPNKQTHSDPMGPSTVESTYTLAEDPMIWFSGGQYHVLYDYPDDRVGYHLTSSDGIHNWTDQGWWRQRCRRRGTRCRRRW